MIETKTSNAPINPTTFAIIIGIFFIKIPYNSQLLKETALIAKAGRDKAAADLQVRIL